MPKEGVVIKQGEFPSMLSSKGGNISQQPEEKVSSGFVGNWIKLVIGEHIKAASSEELTKRKKVEKGLGDVMEVAPIGDMDKIS